MRKPSTQPDYFFRQGEPLFEAALELQEYLKAMMKRQLSIRKRVFRRSASYTFGSDQYKVTTL